MNAALCFDIRQEIISLNQQFINGQDLSMPAPNMALYIIGCQTGFRWENGVRYLNVSCIGDKWTARPVACARILILIDFI